MPPASHAKWRRVLTGRAASDFLAVRCYPSRGPLMVWLLLSRP